MIGPVNAPCDRPIDLLSIASLQFQGEVTIGRSTAQSQLKDQLQTELQLPHGNCGARAIDGTEDAGTRARNVVRIQLVTA